MISNSGSGGSDESSKSRRSIVPATPSVTRYVWPGVRTSVSASTSNTGSIAVGSVNAMLPRVTR